jgi:hypothetical protein
MFVCCECCVLSGRGLYGRLITRPEECYRLWRVVCVISKTSWIREEAIARVGLQRHVKKNIINASIESAKSRLLFKIFTQNSVSANQIPCVLHSLTVPIFSSPIING